MWAKVEAQLGTLVRKRYFMELFVKSRKNSLLTGITCYGCLSLSMCLTVHYFK
jgi:hypothetical protein